MFRGSLAGPSEVVRPTDVRLRNLASVLASLDRKSPQSQTDLVETTGLLGAAISGIVSQLIGWGVLHEERGPATGARGRPRRMLRIAGDAGLAVGVDVNHEAVTVCALDLRGALVGEHTVRHRSTDITARDFSSLIFSWIEQTIGRRLTETTPTSVTVALPGLASRGVTTSRSRGWFTTPIRDFFVAAPPAVRLNGAVNDGDAAVVAEWSALGGVVSDLAVFHGTDGLAGGVIADNRLLQGFEGAAASFGHLPVEPDGGRPCPCGSRGCLARYVSLGAFADDLHEQDDLASLGSVAYSNGLALRARDGETKVLEVLSHAHTLLTAASRIIGASVSPDRILITGNLAPLGPWLTVAVTEPRLQWGTTINWLTPIVTGSNGTSSVSHGAAELARRALLHDPSALAPRPDGQMRDPRESPVPSQAGR